MYSFIPEHASFIEELYDVMLCYKQILAICKRNGLSEMTATQSRNLVLKNLMTEGDRMQIPLM